MKAFGLSILFVLLTMSVTGQAQGLEVRGGANFYFPQGMWKDTAVGGEIKLVEWYEDSSLGFGMSVGWTRWQLDDHHAYNQAAASYDTLQGHADYMPVGLSVLSRNDLNGNPNIMTTVEAGVHYMICNESMELNQHHDAGGGNTVTQTSSLSCEDAIVGRVAAGLELIIRDNRNPTTLFANIGYQFDIDKSRISGTGWTQFSQDVRLEGAFLQVGLAIPLE